jgi:hypothetical protein
METQRVEDVVEDLDRGPVDFDQKGMIRNFL